MKSYLDFGIPEQGPPEGEDLILVFDVSLSMDMKDYKPSRRKGAIAAGLALVDVKAEEAPGDRVAVVVFSGEARVKHPLTVLQGQENRIKKAIRGIQTDSCTNIRAGLKCAGQALDLQVVRTEGLDGPVMSWLKKVFFQPPQPVKQSTAACRRARRILLLSDGASNVGGNPVPVAATLKRQGVVIDVIGIAANPNAQEFNESQLKAIASSPDDGREHYCFIANTQALIKKFESLALHIKPLEV